MSQDFMVRETDAEVFVEWRVERFLSRAVKRNFYLNSPSFLFSDAHWFLEVRTGRDRMRAARSALYLDLCKRFTTTKNHWVKYTLGIRKKDGSVFKPTDVQREFKKYGGHRLQSFVCGSEFNQLENVFSADEAVTIFATLCLTKPTFRDEVVNIPRALPLRATYSEEVSSEWKVENFAFLPKREGFSLNSPTFAFAGAEWCLEVYPKGINGYRGYLSLLLSRVRSLSEKQCLAFTLGIRRGNGTPFRVVHYEMVFIDINEFGCGEFIKSSEMLDSEYGPVHQGSVTFFCTARTIPILPTTTLTERESPAFSHLSHSERGEHSQSICTTLEDYRSFFLKESLSDVTIRVRDQKLPAHRAILAARSSVFLSMFEHDTEERRTGTVNVDDFDPEPFKAFLTFLYSGDVNAVTADNAIPLYEAADKYNVKDLRSECLKSLQSGLCLESFCRVAQLAFLHSDRVLLEIATEFFVKHTKEIVMTPEWQTLTKKHLALTNELIIKMATKRL